MSNNPFQPNTGNFGYEGTSTPQGPIRSKVQPASIALMVAGGVNVLASLYGVGASIFNIVYADQQLALQRQQFDEAIQQNPGQAQFLESVLQLSSMMSGPVGLILNLLGLAIAGFIIFGGWKMMHFSGYGIALTASIVAAIPCLSSCCIVGLPIGIWCIVVLSDSQVKNAFQR